MEKWCQSCQLGTAQYSVTYRTDKYTAKWSTPDGEQYCSNVCHDCYLLLGEEEERGEIWATSTKYLATM